MDIDNKTYGTLVADLCGRVPYGMKFADKDGNTDTLRGVVRRGSAFVVLGESSAEYWADDIRPYLRKMTDMGEDEMEEYGRLKFADDRIYRMVGCRRTGKGFVNIHTENVRTGEEGYTFQVTRRTMLGDGAVGADWLDSRHLDYRDLIGKGLALRAPDGMYGVQQAE